MITEQPEVEHLVAFAQQGEKHILRQVGGLLEILPVGAMGLLVDGQYAPGQESDEAQVLSLLQRETGSLVDAGLAEDGAPAQGGLPDPLTGIPPDCGGIGSGVTTLTNLAAHSSRHS